MSDSLPADLRCPISQDMMNDPVTITHHGKDYNFDRTCIETWKTTPGGDQNPLTMLDGFRSAPIKPATALRERIADYRKANGILEEQLESVKLEPFGDLQQIQDDEVEARRLHMEMNGPPPGMDMGLLLIQHQGPEGIQQMEVNVPIELMNIIASPNIPERMHNIFMDSLISTIMEGSNVE